MNFNQLTVIGYIGKNAETKQLPNGTPVTKFSVATTRSWKDDKGEWKEKTQWHAVAAFGQGFSQLASRLVKGAHVFVQGELTTREYDRTITVPVGKKSVEHLIQQLAVELKAETIPLLDRNANSESTAAAQPTEDEDVPSKGSPSSEGAIRLKLLPGVCVLISMRSPAGLSALSRTLTLFLWADRCPIVTGDLSHGSAEDFRLRWTLNISVQSRVAYVVFTEQRVETTAEGFVARQSTLAGNPIQLPVEGIRSF